MFGIAKPSCYHSTPVYIIPKTLRKTFGLNFQWHIAKKFSKIDSQWGAPSTTKATKTVINFGEKTNQTPSIR